MKVKVIKKASNVKPTGFCSMFVDDPPIDKRSAAVINQK
jgi:hypothetical protein